MFFQGFAGDGADADDFGGGWDGQVEGDEVIDGTATGEGQDVGAFFAETGLGAGFVVGFGHGAVGNGVIDDGPGFGQAGADGIAHFFGANNHEHAVVHAAIDFEQSGQQAVAGHDFGDEVDAEVILPDFGGGAGADGGDAHAADAAHVFVEFMEEGEETFDPIRAREHEPFVFVSILN